MYSNNDIDMVKDIVLRDVPGVTGIILFGSYARGAAADTSDLDILVLIEKNLEWRARREVLNCIYRDTAEKGYLVDFLLKTRRDFDREKSLPTMSRTISENGKILWMKK